MAIKKPIPISFGLDSHYSLQSACAVIHIDDNNTETLDLSLMQSGEHIAVSPNSTVTARFVRVKDKILISDREFPDRSTFFRTVAFSSPSRSLSSFSAASRFSSLNACSRPCRAAAS